MNPYICHLFGSITMSKPVKTLGLRPLWLISAYSKPVQRWRTESTPSAQALNDSPWMWDFWGTKDEDDNLLDWLSHRLILGPPRYRTGRELAEMDESYLAGEEFLRHYVPWMKTWPHPDDHSWCTGPYRTTLPEWVTTGNNAVN